jgi:hypothetical protein
MSIKYILKPTAMPGQEGKFMAAVSPSYTLKFEESMSEIAERANCAEGTVYNIMSAYLDIIKRHLANSTTVYMGNLGRIYPSREKRGTYNFSR